MERVRLVISGRVQGVAYRANARAEAQRLRLVGWVRNLDDGRVEALAEGERETLEAFVAWSRRGPRAARVDDVAVERGEATGEFRGFEIAF